MLFEARLTLEAAEVFADRGRYDEALTLLLGPRASESLDRLSAAELPHAARYFEAAGRFDEAAKVHRRLGDADSARRVALRAQDAVGVSSRRSFPPAGSDPPPGDRSSVVPVSDRRMGAAWLIQKGVEAHAARDFKGAAKLFGEAEDYVSVARCMLDAGDKPAALAAIIRVPRESERYREACVAAITLADELNAVDYDFDQFVSRLVRQGPSSRRELEAVSRLADLFEKNGFMDNARDALRAVIAVDPSFKDARQRLLRLERAERGSAIDFEHVVKEDAAFRKPRPAAEADSSETFPSLPELPPVPARPRKPVDTPMGVQPAIPRASNMATVATPATKEAPADQVGPRPLGLRPIADVFTLPAGFVVGGRYRVEAPLGRGGMAAVYRAHDSEIDERIAIKIFAPTGRDDEAQISRFKQELSLARQLTHPNIVRVHDIGTHGNARFITMELLVGKDLADLIDESREMVRDLGYLIQACEGLQCAHERGVVHRDLKPENLFITDAGVLKVMDFGIAKRQQAAEAAKLTQAGYSAGTPAYMAPEQISDFRSATHLSDLYSLGVIAYRLFTGELPFDHENPMALMMKHLQDRPAPPSSVDAAIPDELEFIIMQLLEKEPGRRIQSCRDLGSDLESLRRRLAGMRKKR